MQFEYAFIGAWGTKNSFTHTCTGDDGSDAVSVLSRHKPVGHRVFSLILQCIPAVISQSSRSRSRGRFDIHHLNSRLLKGLHVEVERRQLVVTLRFSSFLTCT